MIKAIADAAYRIDVWLQSRLGRPYVVALSVGLVVDIVHQAIELTHKIHTSGHVVGEIASILFATALLIHQAGALSHRFESRKGERLRHKGAAPTQTHEPPVNVDERRGSGRLPKLPMTPNASPDVGDRRAEGSQDEHPA